MPEDDSCIGISPSGLTAGGELLGRFAEPSLTPLETLLQQPTDPTSSEYNTKDVEGERRETSQASKGNRENKGMLRGRVTISQGEDTPTSSGGMHLRGSSRFRGRR